MQEDHPRVERAPSRPLLIFDGDCGFCRRQVDRWKRSTGDLVTYAPYQSVAEQFPEIPIEKFDEAVYLIETDGTAYGAGEACFRLLTYTFWGRIPLWFYQRVPGCRAFAEWGYRLVAGHRGGVSRIQRWLHGPGVEPTTFFLARWIFLRALGAIYFMAFLSLWVQIDGLVGNHGILPAENLLKSVSDRFGTDAYWRLPTLYWFLPPDSGLHILCGGGILLSVLMIAGVLPLPVLILLWAFYLSLAQVGQIFLGYQWDILLCEVGFMAIFLAPTQLRLTLSRKSPPPRLAIWMCRWLLFRLMLMSGIVKLASNDDSWWNLTALTYHYWTQPLPTWVAWYAHQLPLWFQKFSVYMTFVIEIWLPFLIFAPRKLRLVAFWGLVFFQVVIAITGNYTFFNYLTIVLCILLLDDSIFPKKWRNRIPAVHEGYISKKWLWMIIPHRLALITFAVVIFLATSGLLILKLDQCSAVRRARKAGSGQVMADPKPGRLVRIARSNVQSFYPGLARFHIVAGYGLFAAMTKTRPEIIVEGSMDGSAWKTYAFKWKPTDLQRRPTFVAPHQPRLDWQMWFASLGNWRGNPWFYHFVGHLLRGTPEVLKLLEHNPFPDRPPTYIRATVYEYTFTDSPTRRETGEWWHRQLKGPYLPRPITLRDYPPSAAH